MLHKLIVLALLLISFIPNFGYKNILETKLKDKVLSSSGYQKISYDHQKIPTKSDDFTPQIFASHGAYFEDFDSGVILYEKNSNIRMPMASTTKLMTALIVIEKLSPSQIVKVNKLDTKPLDAVMGLSVGDQLSVAELLHGLLIESGADAAESLASAVTENKNDFVALMNEKASELGLADTQFTNVVGYDDSGHYTTPSDLAKLAKIALLNKQITEIVAKSSYTAQSTSGKKYYLANTNQLLANPYFKGVKTGTTLSAGQCLVSLYDDGQRKILGVVLASPDRFLETGGIIEWSKRNFLW